MAKRREFSVFSLSFLDVMSCGFGAVILIFIIINHSTEATSQGINAQAITQYNGMPFKSSDLVSRMTELIATQGKELVQV